MARVGVQTPQIYIIFILSNFRMALLVSLLTLFWLGVGHLLNRLILFPFYEVYTVRRHLRIMIMWSTNIPT